jgi:hypothetical protein
MTQFTIGMLVIRTVRSEYHPTRYGEVGKLYEVVDVREDAIKIKCVDTGYVHGSFSLAKAFTPHETLTPEDFL